MKLIYLGADVPSNRKILEMMGMQDVGVSFWRLKQRGLPKTKPYLFSNYFSPFMRIHLHPGIPADAQLTREELEKFSGEYEEFVANNLDRITTFTEVDHLMLSKEQIEHQRATAWNDPELHKKFIPIWRSDYTLEHVKKMAELYKDIAIPSDMIEDDTSLAAKTRSLSTTYGVRFHALGVAKPDNLRQVHVATASTMSWLSPMMRGETIVWDGRRLVRYPKKMKEQARPRYTHVYAQAGLDYDSIMNDNAIEVCKLALWSYEKFEEWFQMTNGSNNDENLYDKSVEPLGESNAENTPVVHDNKGTEMRKVSPRNPAEKYVLPTFGLDLSETVTTDLNGNDLVSEVATLSSSKVSLRQCNTCFVASNCPAFTPDTECAFSLPVELKTAEQLKAALTAILEMQVQRIAFARFSEEINGGYPDPNVSQEIDRLYKLVTATKNLDTNREFIQITAERTTGGGVLSQIFGERASNITQQPAVGMDENQTTRMIQQAIEE